jgi:DNA replication and repair protein RecF
VLSQAALYAERKSEWPIVCLDDLASELDKAHQAALVGRLKGVGAQVLVAGTEVPEALQDASTSVFHVEQGTLSPLL